MIAPCQTDRQASLSYRFLTAVMWAWPGGGIQVEHGWNLDNEFLGLGFRLRLGQMQQQYDCDLCVSYGYSSGCIYFDSRERVWSVHQSDRDLDVCLSQSNDVCRRKRWWCVALSMLLSVVHIYGRPCLIEVWRCMHMHVHLKCVHGHGPTALKTHALNAWMI